MLAAMRIQPFGQAPAPIEERRRILKMLAELRTLPTEFADLKVVNVVVVADDVATPTPEPPGCCSGRLTTTTRAPRRCHRPRRPEKSDPTGGCNVIASAIESVVDCVWRPILCS
jgi:hypothetical protein